MKTMIMPEAWYQKLDAGIRFGVRVLHAASGIETAESCEGGAGHAYPEPTICLVDSGDDAVGFRALAALAEYGIDVGSVAIVWSVRKGLPYQRYWHVTLRQTYPERADELPGFVHGYIVQGAAEVER